jgi:predicted dienelactone hydrolase
LITVQLLFEGYRWQMVPLYCITVMLALMTAPNLRFVKASQAASSPKRANWLRLLGSVLNLFAIGLAATLPILFPHLRLPKPSGPYTVGTANLHFFDKNRPETFTRDLHDCRELFARIWYPAEIPTGKTPVSYCENAHEISRALTGPTRLSSFLFDPLALTKTCSYRDAEIADGKEPFPVVIFSHAYWGSVSQCTALMQELASQGYVAVSVGHPYETPYLIQADGHIRAFDPRNEEFRLRGVERQAAFDVEQRLTQTGDLDELEAIIRDLSRRRPKAVESVHIWAEDVSSTIDKLERINLGNGIFAGRLDLGRVAVLGHSFGGAAAGQACLYDARCKAGVNMDGLQLGDMLDKDLSCPFLFMHHDNVGAPNKTPNLVFFENAKAPAYLLTIEGAGHLSFTDLSFYGRASFFRLMLSVGEIDGEHCHRIVCDYVLAFLDRHLRGRDSDLLDGTDSRHPEVEMRTRIPDREESTK